MHSCLRYCYIFFCLISVIYALTLPSLDSTDTNLNVIASTDTNHLTAGLAPDLPNHEFDYTSKYSGRLLPDIPCMMVCVFAMRELALLSNFNGGCEIPGKTWIMDEYPQVAISVGNPDDVVTVRFAMWTITSAIRNMMIRNQFQTSQFVGTWLGVRVVYMNFFAPNTIETTVVKTHTEYAVSQSSADTATVSINIGDSNRNVTLNDDQLRAEVIYKTKEISKKDMFMAVIIALLTLAPHETEERIRIVTITEFAITASVTTYFIRVLGIPRRLQPLQYGNLISLLAKIPEILFREDMFREMDIVVKDDNVVVGKGTVRLTASSGFEGDPLIANASVS